MIFSHNSYIESFRAFSMILLRFFLRFALSGILSRILSEISLKKAIHRLQPAVAQTEPSLTLRSNTFEISSEISSSISSWISPGLPLEISNTCSQISLLIIIQTFLQRFRHCFFTKFPQGILPIILSEISPEVLSEITYGYLLILSLGILSTFLHGFLSGFFPTSILGSIQGFWQGFFSILSKSPREILSRMAQGLFIGLFSRFLQGFLLEFLLDYFMYVSKTSFQKSAQNSFLMFFRDSSSDFFRCFS